MLTQPGNSDKGWSTKSHKDQITRDMSRDPRDQLGMSRDQGGWTGERVERPQANCHPLIEQREILRAYLRQVCLLFEILLTILG